MTKTNTLKNSGLVTKSMLQDMANGTVVEANGLGQHKKLSAQTNQKPIPGAGLVVSPLTAESGRQWGVSVTYNRVPEETDHLSAYSKEQVMALAKAVSYLHQEVWFVSELNPSPYEHWNHPALLIAGLPDLKTVGHVHHLSSGVLAYKDENGSPASITFPVPETGWACLTKVGGKIAISSIITEDAVAVRYAKKGVNEFFMHSYLAVLLEGWEVQAHLGPDTTPFWDKVVTKSLVLSPEEARKYADENKFIARERNRANNRWHTNLRNDPQGQNLQRSINLTVDGQNVNVLGLPKGTSLYVYMNGRRGPAFLVTLTVTGNEDRDSRAISSYLLPQYTYSFQAPQGR